MKIKTVSGEVIKYLKQKKCFVFGGELERIISIICHVKPSTVARILRDMSEHKLILKTYEKKVGITRGVVKYKTK